MTTSFNLLTEPWVMAREPGGSTTEVSLVDVFSQAPRLRGLVGDLPTQEVAVLRLLLAVLHRALPVGDRLAAAAWHEHWSAESPPIDAIETYLHQHAERFDLLHPTSPFLQVAALSTAKGQMTGLDRLVADVPAGHRYFTTRSGAALDRMTFAEAARWVVHCHAFDVSGIKSGAVGDDRTRGGKGYPIGTGWVGQLGVVLIEGGNLWETLLLNLVMRTENPDDPPDYAVWERNPVGPGIETGHEQPRGVADLFTWQSRRIRLGHDGSAVTAALIANGDALHPVNMHHTETMTAWRQSDNQKKKLGLTEAYMPRTHMLDRSVWRGLAALLSESGHAPAGSRAASGLPPRVLEWLADLENNAWLDPDTVMRTRTVGLTYGSQSSVVEGMVDDALVLRAATIAEAPLKRCVLDAVAHADAGAFAVANLATDLVRAAGGDPTGPRDTAREQAYMAMDSIFRRWVSTLRAGSDVPERLTAWDQAARRTLSLVGDQIVTSAGTPAWVGREVDGRQVDTGTAHLRFLAGLHAAFPFSARERERPQHQTPEEVR